MDTTKKERLIYKLWIIIAVWSLGPLFLTVLIPDAVWIPVIGWWGITLYVFPVLSIQNLLGQHWIGTSYGTDLHWTLVGALVAVLFWALVLLTIGMIVIKKRISLSERQDQKFVADTKKISVSVFRVFLYSMLVFAIILTIIALFIVR